jgi:putative tryptophan/tyrosine transport system substrate-binding protein
MRRREFLGALGGVATCPLTAHAQQSITPLIGFMSARSPEDSAQALAQFHKGLGEGGIFEGRNVAIEYRWAHGDYEQLPRLVDELVKRSVTVLAAVGGDASARAAKTAALSLPVVFAMGGDPVDAGLLKSFNRPDGNMTGVVILSSDAETKRFGLLHELVPSPGAFGALVNPKFPPSTGQLAELNQAAAKLNRPLVVVKASDDAELDAAFATLLQARLIALQVASDPFFDTRRQRIVTFAAQNKIPAIYQFREYVLDGGLMSYGPDLPDAYRQVGVYASRILKGEKPADLPVLRATKFEFLINLKTAKALGLSISPSLLLRADEVIE